MTENKSFKESHPLDDFISDKELSNTTIQKEKLTIEQQKQVDTISKQINPLDNEGLLAFGSDLQKQMSQFHIKCWMKYKVKMLVLLEILCQI